jgi:hypothetical protein
MDTKTVSERDMEQLVDWRAAVIAGLIAGAIFLPLLMIGRAYLTGGSIWIMPRYIAAIVLGTDVLPPPPTFDAGIFVVALLLHFALSLIFALVLAAIIHEWELVVGIVVGALFGVALYAINYYTFSRFFPWFYPARSWVDLLAHVIFGMVAGGAYEALEIERFVPED